MESLRALHFFLVLKLINKVSLLVFNEKAQFLMNLTSDAQVIRENDDLVILEIKVMSEIGAVQVSMLMLVTRQILTIFRWLTVCKRKQQIFIY